MVNEAFARHRKWDEGSLSAASSSAALAAMDDAETGGAGLAGIREGSEPPAALAANRGIFPRAELLWRRLIAATAFARPDHPESVGPCHAGICKCPPQPTALAADRCVFPGAGLLNRWTEIGAAFAAVQDAKSVGTRVAGIGEGSEAVAAFAADRREFHGAHLRRPDRRPVTRFVDDNRAGGEQAHDRQDCRGWPRK